MLRTYLWGNLPLLLSKTNDWFTACVTALSSAVICEGGKMPAVVKWVCATKKNAFNVLKDLMHPLSVTASSRWKGPSPFCPWWKHLHSDRKCQNSSRNINEATECSCRWMLCQFVQKDSVKNKQFDGSPTLFILFYPGLAMVTRIRVDCGFLTSKLSKIMAHEWA